MTTKATVSRSKAKPKRRLHDFELIEFDATTLQNGLLDIKHYAGKALKSPENMDYENVLREIVRMVDATMMGLEEEKAIFHNELRKVAEETEDDSNSKSDSETQ
jgi:hypothetical protein